MSAREQILRRIRAALGDRPDRARLRPRTDEAAPTPYDDLTTLFCDRVADYRAVVVRCPAADLARQVAQALPPGAGVVVPPGLAVVVPQARVDYGLSTAEVDRMDAVVTSARLGIAETGTVVLDHAEGQGRRVLTLLPDRHVCIVTADQIVADVPDAIARLDPLRPQTWISGPSATSDIELDRVEGVHGPRHLTVIVVEPG